MSERESCVAYIVQPARGDALSLAVLDKERGAYHMFPLSIAAASRLCLETAMALNEKLGGQHPKFDQNEIAEALSRRTTCASG